VKVKRIVPGVKRRVSQARERSEFRRELDRGERALKGLEGTDNWVQLGAGADLRPDWVNVDMWEGGREQEPPPGARAITHDLRRGLSVPPGSCSRIYSSHFMEHLPWRAGQRMVAQSKKALAPGGQFRMVVPDFRLLAERYLAGDEEFFESSMPRRQFPIHSRPGAESIIDWMNYAIYQDGEHVCMFDGEKAVRLLTSFGFKNARVSEFDPEWDLDIAVRRRLSVYVHAER
jgi:hypothetical protein